MSMLGGQPRVACKKCKRKLPIDRFGMRRLKGELVRKLNCPDCLEKLGAAQKRYSETVHGKEAIAARAAVWNASQDHLDALSRYHETDEYRTAVRKYDGSDKGKAKQKRRNDAVAADPGKKLMKAIMNRLSDELSGRREDFSSKLASYTDFVDGEDAAQHFQSQFVGNMTLDNYGTVWAVDHIIARKWYDEGDEEDLRRCWSRTNLQPLPPVENNHKRIAIPEDAVLYAVGIEKWPKAWKGVPPDEATKQAWYKLHHDMRMGKV